MFVYARENWNRPIAWMATLGGAAYGVYVFHVFTVVGLNQALPDFSWAPFIKFVLVTLATLVISFSTMIALRKRPSVARIFW